MLKSVVDINPSIMSKAEIELQPLCPETRPCAFCHHGHCVSLSDTNFKGTCPFRKMDAAYLDVKTLEEQVYEAVEEGYSFEEIKDLTKFRRFSIKDLRRMDALARRTYGPAIDSTMLTPEEEARLLRA